MKSLRDKAAKSVRRHLAVALLGALALSGFAAYAVFAAGGKADFAIAASPSSQTVTQGQATTYTVTITRVNGFTGSVTLSAGDLPSGATASWKLSNGTNSNVVPPSLNSATLTVNTGSSTPTGTTQPLITATSGKLSHTTTITLAVQPQSQPNFALAASPASQTMSQGDETSYAVSISRTGGFSGAVNLTVAGLPKGATASWDPAGTVSGTSATLRIQTATNTGEGTYTPSITGTGTVNGSPVSRSAAVTLVVQKNQDFQIVGDLGTQLAPGLTAPLNLSLTNPYNYTIKVTNLSVAVEEATSAVGCSGTENFDITQVPAARYPITLPANAARTLTQLGVADGDKPRVKMVDKPWNQDACKSAKLILDYAGSATK